MLGLHEKWRGTFIEAWPDAVRDLGLPLEEFRLSEQDRLAIGSRTAAFREIFEIDELPELTKDFRQAIDVKAATFPGGAHARLGGCSFKRPGRRQSTGIAGFLDLEPYILRENPRVAGLLASSLQESFDIYLFLRPWIDIPEWTEFRLFMKNRSFIGASQYFHTRSFHSIEQNVDRIAYAMIHFTRNFQAVAHLDDAIVDVFIDQGEGDRFDVTLLDINPLIWRSDSCLFRWENGGDFDRGLRFRGSGGRVLSTPSLPLA